MDASKKSKKAGGKEKQPLPPSSLLFSAVLTLVNVYVDLLVFTRIAGTS